MGALRLYWTASGQEFRVIWAVFALAALLAAVTTADSTAAGSTPTQHHQPAAAGTPGIGPAVAEKAAKAETVDMFLPVSLSVSVGQGTLAVVGAAPLHVLAQAGSMFGVQMRTTPTAVPTAAAPTTPTAALTAAPAAAAAAVIKPAEAGKIAARNPAAAAAKPRVTAKKQVPPQPQKPVTPAPAPKKQLKKVPAPAALHPKPPAVKPKQVAAATKLKPVAPATPKKAPAAAVTKQQSAPTQRPLAAPKAAVTRRLPGAPKKQQQQKQQKQPAAAPRVPAPAAAAPAVTGAPLPSLINQAVTTVTGFISGLLGMKLTPGGLTPGGLTPGGQVRATPAAAGHQQAAVAAHQQAAVAAHQQAAAAAVPKPKAASHSGVKAAAAAAVPKPKAASHSAAKAAAAAVPKPKAASHSAAKAAAAAVPKPKAASQGAAKAARQATVAAAVPKPAAVQKPAAQQLKPGYAPMCEWRADLDSCSVHRRYLLAVPKPESYVAKLVSAAAARDDSCRAFLTPSTCLDMSAPGLMCGWAMSSGSAGYDRGCHSMYMAEWDAFVAAQHRLGSGPGAAVVAAQALPHVGSLTCPGSLAQKSLQCSSIYPMDHQGSYVPGICQQGSGCAFQPETNSCVTSAPMMELIQKLDPRITGTCSAACYLRMLDQCTRAQQQLGQAREAWCDKQPGCTWEGGRCVVDVWLSKLDRWGQQVAAAAKLCGAIRDEEGCGAAGVRRALPIVAGRAAQFVSQPLGAGQQSVKCPV